MHLNLEERRKIAQWLEARMPVPEIADRLSRAPSSIYREIKRNFYDDKEIPYLNGYYAIEPPRVYRRVSGSMIRLLFRQRSSLHRRPPLLLAA